MSLSLSSMSQEKKRVACIGNSVTFGYAHKNPAETSYPTRLGQMLGDDYEVRNFGHSGATLLKKGHRPYIQQKAYTQALEFAPDYAIIHLGLNDTDPRNWPNYRDEFIPDYLSLIDTLRSLNPDVKVWICRMSPIFNRHSRFKSGTRDWYWQIQETIEHIAQIADVGLIDLQEPLYCRPDLFGDALHPDPEGAQIIANTVYSAMTGDYGGLSLPAIYSSRMVIQRDRPFTLHGKANAGSEVKVRLGKKKCKTTTAANGKWSVTLEPMKATGKPMTLTVESGKEKIELTDILVGEVWLCSGQSNMAWMLKQANDADKHIAAAASKNIRLYDMKPRVITDPISWDSTELARLNRHDYYIPTEWKATDNTSAANFSAIAYHFGAMLADSLGVPVGLICNAVGGAPTEAFIDRKTMEHHPLLVDILYDWKKSDFVQDWARGRAALNIKNSTNPLQRHPYEPCYLYEAGIAPIAGYPIKGVIWYQGESNAHNVELHEIEFRTLVDSWRNTWNNPEMPFHFVQLSSINRPSWPHFRNSQRLLADEISNCYMSVSSDKGDPTDVHPRDKQPIGERLALSALHHVYDYSHIVPEGPAATSATAEGDEAIVTFEYADGMHTSDKEALRTFEIADETRIFHPADKATIEGNTIRLSSSKIKRPAYIRYGWQPYTTANLVNGSGLPASTFMITVE